MDPARPPTRPAEVEAFIADNQGPLRDLAWQVQRLTNAGNGVNRVDIRQMSGSVGEYRSLLALVSLEPKTAAALAGAVSQGEVDSGAQLEAVRVLLHEMLHGASQRHGYRHDNGTVAMEEATTEFLAQHMKRSFAESSLGLRVTYKRDAYGMDPHRPVFEANSAGEVSVGRPVAYISEVTGFGRMVKYVDDLDAANMTPAALNEHIAGRARQAKERVGDGGPEDGRYGMFVRPLLDRFKVAPDHPRYQQIVEQLQALLARVVMDGNWLSGRIDAEVRRIVGGPSS